MSKEFRISSFDFDASDSDLHLSEPSAAEIPLSEEQRPKIIAIGGGKGGVGKSLLAANLGIYLAQVGNRTLLLDLDLGGANLHTFVGVNRPQATLGDLFRKRVSKVEDCIVETPIGGLQLISAEGDPLWAAEPRPTTRRRLLQGIRNLDVDFVVCDLPAGSGFMALDFFALAQVGILVVVPEPTSAENAYRFIKSAFLRRLRTAKDENNVPLGNLIEQLGLTTGDAGEGGIPAPLDLYAALQPAYPMQADTLAREMTKFRPRLVINQTRSRADLELGNHMRTAGRNRLGLPIESLGSIDSDDAVWQAVRRRKPLLTEYPESRAAAQIEKLARKLVSPTEAERAAPFSPRLREQQTLYDILEVEPGASEGDIRKAVRHLKEIYASDSMIISGLYSVERLHWLHRKIEEAYDTLLNVEKRRRYDLALFPEGIPTMPQGTQGKGGSLHPLASQPVTESPIQVTADTEFSGSLLKQIRESIGLNLADIADRTKIGSRHLRAIEEETWSALPAAVYLRGFVAEYARCLHLNVIQVTKTYLHRLPTK